MQWQYVVDFLNNPLVDVVIGALVGGWFSYRGAMSSANKNIKALYDQEKRARASEKEKLQKIVKVALLSETKQNLSILQGGYRVGFATISLVNEMWNLYKGHIDFLSEPTQKCLIDTYSSISRYNSLVEYDKAYTNANHAGTSELVSKLQEMAEEIILELKVSIDFLEQKNTGLFVK